MKYLFLILVLSCSSAYAESAKQWLDAYFAVVDAREKAHAEFLVSRDSTLKDVFETEGRYFKAEEAMYRYIFGYHIEHTTGLLDWSDGDWTMSIMVCNCEAEGSVPTPEFKELFAARSKALIETNEKLPKDVVAKIRALEKEMPKGWSQTYRERISQLRGGFDALIKKPNKAPEPTTVSVTHPADAGCAPDTVVAHL